MGCTILMCESLDFCWVSWFGVFFYLLAVHCDALSMQDKLNWCYLISEELNSFAVVFYLFIYFLFLSGANSHFPSSAEDSWTHQLSTESYVVSINVAPSLS